MNKKIKRFISIFAVLALLALPSCGGSAESVDADIEKESEKYFSSLQVLPAGTENGTSSNVSVKPQEFTVLVEAEKNDFFADETASDTESQLLFERNNALYENHSVKLVEKVVPDITEAVLVDMLSEESDYDMIILSANDTAPLISAGALADLEALAGFNSGAKGYAKNVIDSLSIGGRSFLATGDALPSFMRSVSAVLVAPDLYQKSSAPNFTEIAKSGNFTYETMLTLSRSFADINGVGDADFYIDADTDDALPLFLGGGGIFFETDPVTDVFAPIDFTSANSGLYTPISSIYGITGEDETEETQPDTEKLFTVATLGELRSYTDTHFALPMPKSSSSQADYRCSVRTDTALFTALPSNGEDNDSAVAIMNLIYGLSAPIKNALAESLGTSDAERDVVQLILDSAYADLPSLLGYGDTHALLSSAIGERISEKAFILRGNERSAAVASALSILSAKLIK
ncbi:MAG: hypothetical protein E7671_02595 [Ruminococcaceae bacterium]|nr:hypothetical protein [Oscillospiraceae bacterium]